MAEKQSVKVGPVELRVRFFSENSEWKVLWIENGKSVSKRIYYTDNKQDAMTTMASMAKELEVLYVDLPSCYGMPKGRYEITRDNTRNSYSLKHGKHVIRYYLDISTVDMAIKLAVDFDGIRWDQRTVTDLNREAVQKFWSMIEKKAFHHREERVGKIRDNAQEYFRNLYTE